MMQLQFAVVVPVKPPAHGKSRLVGVPDDHRRALAEAFALDTVSATLAAQRVGAVLAVTDDASFAAAASALDCAAIPDGVTGDLNATLRLAAAEAQRRWPELTCVALCADLPALRATDLDAALDQVEAALAAGDTSCFVADAAGVGTTLYCAAYDAFDPRFGADSRQAHLASGATEIDGELATLRHDVDDLDDLRVAARLGLGRHTIEQTFPKVSGA